MKEKDFDEKYVVSLEEFSLICAVEVDYVIELVDVGILEPKGNTVEEWQFTAMQTQRLKKAARLQHDLHLNMEGVALSLELLDEVAALREYIKNLEHQLKLLSLS